MIRIEKIQGRDCISWSDAKRLCAPGNLPRLGYEKLIQHEGCHFWLQEISLGGQTHWWIRKTPWRYNACKQAVLDRNGIATFRNETGRA